MTSVVSICNKALSRLGANRILSIDDDTPEGILCKDNYESIRDIVLEEHQWTFATKRYLLPKVQPTGGQVSQYANFYLLPVQVINVIRAGSNINDDEPNGSEWQIEGEYITSDADTMYIKAIVKVTDPQLYSPMFVQALAVRLASELAMPIVQSLDVQRSQLQEYGGILDDAAKKDGQQGTTPQIRSGRYIAVRGAGEGYVGPTV